MTVADARPVRFQPFNGFLNPSFPEGYWKGAAEVTGDASGGNAVLSVTFNQVETSRSGRMFNVEQLDVWSTSVGATVFGHTQVANLGDLLGGSATALRSFLMRVTPNAHALDYLTGLLVPQVLGAEEDSAQVSTYSIVLPNENLIVFSMEAQGYWWGPRSRTADGGPQKPPFGLFSR